MLRRPLFALACLALAGCAVNLSEMRPPRVLDKGQMQVTQANNIVAPLGVIPLLVDKGKTAISDVQKGKAPTSEQVSDLVGSAVAISLMGPGYGTHLDFGYGLGHGFDVSGRVGNGIYGGSLRYGLGGKGGWVGNVGLRVAWDTGGSWLSYLDNLNDYVNVASMTRLDAQGWVQLGRELGLWGRLWLGAKAMGSRYWMTLDGSKLDLPTEKLDGSLAYLGGFAGGAVGYRFFYFVAELSVFQGLGSLEAFGHPYDLSGLVICPSWGIEGTWGGGT